ncbi:hypothetical protein HELRODRAFT_171148 [Helobdella robusta]|uniref:Uncharacterized protein n=1 Tax=Helobdella robusta TaxID=6412 RepID=T1F3V2_HELRO|nr:hypothetical protein HELRODRAFT_171148 [Helobdella robusta]ESO05510.1 hypothetical protein HELRODRAFT_171148 [Helobdella robusta]
MISGAVQPSLMCMPVLLLASSLTSSPSHIVHANTPSMISVSEDRKFLLAHLLTKNATQASSVRTIKADIQGNAPMVSLSYSSYCSQLSSTGRHIRRAKNKNKHCWNGGQIYDERVVEVEAWAFAFKRLPQRS